MLLQRNMCLKQLFFSIHDFVHKIKPLYCKHPESYPLSSRESLSFLGTLVDLEDPFVQMSNKQ